MVLTAGGQMITTMHWFMSLFGAEAQDSRHWWLRVTHTAQGLNASLTHPCSVNTEVMCVLRLTGM